MQWNWLISPLAGSIIGYGTNYLAIKMLFKPHNVKYIGKIKVPFTPGLIPKEKGTLARQIGDTVEEHLLNEDVLVETLTSLKAREAFFSLMGGVPKYMEKSEQTIEQIIAQLLETDMEQSLEVLADQFVVEIVTMFRSREIIDTAIPYLSEIITNTVDQYICNMADNSTLNHQIQQIGKEILENEKVKGHMNQALNDLEAKIDIMIEENASSIGKGIIKAIAEGEEAEKIKASIQMWADEHFNPMVLMFVKIDKIYEGIMDYAYEALDDSEQTDKFAQLLLKIIKGLRHEQFESFIKCVKDGEEDDAYESDYKDKIIALIGSQINEANINIVIQGIQDVLGQKQGNKKMHIEQWLYDQWDAYVNSQDIFELSRKILESVAGFIGNTSLANLSMIIPKETHGQVQERVFEFYTHLIKKNSKTIVDVMDISVLVEGKINQFSSQEAEEIILSVVKNQLRGITWIGALLGFMIGLIPNFIG